MTSFSALPFATRRYTPEEYLALEEQFAEKLEFHDGHITQMAGGSARHNELALRIGAMLLWALDDQPFRVYNSDMKICIPFQQRFVYPDAVVVSREPAYYQDREDIITNPLLVVEVSSPSTAVADRETKFDAYRHVPSFETYVLVRQDMAMVSVYQREGKDLWRTKDYAGLEEVIELASLGIQLESKKLYKGVAF